LKPFYYLRNSLSCTETLVRLEKITAVKTKVGPLITTDDVSVDSYVTFQSTANTETVGDPILAEVTAMLHHQHSPTSFSEGGVERVTPTSQGFVMDPPPPLAHPHHPHPQQPLHSHLPTIEESGFLQSHHSQAPHPSATSTAVQQNNKTDAEMEDWQKYTLEQIFKEKNGTKKTLPVLNMQSRFASVISAKAQKTYSGGLTTHPLALPYRFG
jgi:hypothetical protein